MNYDFESVPQEDQFSQDDLLAFEEFQQNRVVEEVMKMKVGLEEIKNNPRDQHMSMKPGNDQDVIEDDADLIRAGKQKKPETVKPKKNEITEEQRKARQLKLLNARKYFQVAKLMYIQHVAQALKQTKKIAQNSSKVFSQFLSLLDHNLLTQFIQFKKTKPLSINITELLALLKKSKAYITSKKKEEAKSLPAWNIVFMSICETLKLGCRKVYFFNVDSIVEEVFFQLKYQSSQAHRKRQNKKIKQHQMLKIRLTQQIQQNFQDEEDTSKYLLFQDFEFDENSFKNKQAKVRESQTVNVQTQQSKREYNFIRKKNYKSSYYQLFDPTNDSWVLVNSQILQSQDIQNMKKIILESKFILGFYSTRILHFKKQFSGLAELRKLKNILIEDLSMFLEDNNRQLNSRRKRIGLKAIIRQIFHEGSVLKYRFLLQNYDAYLMDKNDAIELQYQLTIFPKTREEMLTSNYFIVPSQLPQYSILSQEARPVPEIEFHQQKVYLRKDIISVTSKVHWIDRGRQVKAGELPVKKTQNKSKNLTQLYLYEQTEPFQLAIDPQTGKFITDSEFDSIYVPADFVPPPQMTIVNKKVGHVCTKAKIRHAKVVQGFTRAGGRIVPNDIGYLVYKDDVEEVLKLHEERQAKLEQNKGKNRIKELTAIWNKLFKKIQLNQWSRSFQDK